MRLDFPVVIQRKTVAVSERGFGTILILDNKKDIDFKYVDAEDLKGLDGAVLNIANRLFMQKPQPQKVAVFGKAGAIDVAFNAALEANNDFFFVVSTDNTTESIKKLAELAQVNNKIYGVTVNSAADTKKLYELKNDNTFIMYHDDPKAYAAEAMTVIMSYKVGGKTAKFKTIQGVRAAKISTTELNELHEHKMFTYVEKLGVLQTTEGKVLSGEYIDIVLGEYWIRFKMEEALQRLALVNDKIPYTNTGIGMIVGACEAILNRAVEQGIVEKGQYKVDYKLREDVLSNDVALRKYDYVMWTAMLQGAIHTGQISGILTYDVVNGGAK